MLTKEEKDYLEKIDSLRKVAVYPYDPKGKELGKRIVEKIKRVFPKAEVLFMGSVALEISGQRDIDIYVLVEQEKFRDFLPGLEKLFGRLDKDGEYLKKRSIKWEFEEDGYNIEIYLTEPPDRQIKVYEILKKDKNLLKEYEELKLRFGGGKYKDYQRAKYEFYNKILN